MTTSAQIVSVSAAIETGHHPNTSHKPTRKAQLSGVIFLCIKRRWRWKRDVCMFQGGVGLLVGSCRCSAMRPSSWLTQISWGKGKKDREGLRH